MYGLAAKALVDLSSSGYYGVSTVPTYGSGASLLLHRPRVHISHRVDDADTPRALVRRHAREDLAQECPSGRQRC